MTKIFIEVVTCLSVGLAFALISSTFLLLAILVGVRYHKKKQEQKWMDW